MSSLRGPTGRDLISSARDGGKRAGEQTGKYTVTKGGVLRVLQGIQTECTWRSRAPAKVKEKGSTRSFSRRKKTPFPEKERGTPGGRVVSLRLESIRGQLKEVTQKRRKGVLFVRSTGNQGSSKERKERSQP